MGIRTAEGYINSLREQKPLVYMDGEKIDNIVDHPLFKPGINSIAQSYRIAQDPKYKDMVTLISPIINEPISRWTHLVQNEQDVIARVKLMRQGMGDYTCQCVYREVTVDALCTAWIVSFDIDKKYGTKYHERVVNIAKQAQKNDLAIALAIIDSKGNRALRPSKQPDPDAYVHVVKKTGDGIIVRGAKPHSTASVYCNMLCIAPDRPLLEDEKDYAVAFFTPNDAKGITYISRPASKAVLHAEGIECPLSSKLGHVESMLVLDDVFVPWENVFMCGEQEFMGLFNSTITGYHIHGKTGCHPASLDIAIGALALIAEYNGVEKASHIKEYMNEMIMDAELLYYAGIAAAVEGKKHESGLYIPNVLASAIGKILLANNVGREHFVLQDAAGGSVVSMPSDKDYNNPATRKFIDKYLKGSDQVPTEHRLRIIRLIEDLIASEYAGWYQALCIVGGAPPQSLKPFLRSEYDIEASKKKAKLAAGITD